MAGTQSTSTILPSEIEEIWREYQVTRSVHLLDILTVEYLPRVRKIAERIATKLPKTVELDDLLQEGVLGLRRAIQSFDTERGVLFTTFVFLHVRGAILDSLRHADWTPRLVQSRWKEVEGVVRQFEMTTGRKPTETELVEALGKSNRNVGATMRDARRVRQTSLSLLRTHYDDGCEFSPEAVLSAVNTPDPVAVAQARELRQLITSGFTRAERLLLMLYYYENMTMKEIGMTLDLSESRVSQMHSSLVLRLRATMREKRHLFLGDGS